MNKISLFSALILAINGTATDYTYGDAYAACFEWDDSTGAYVKGDIATFTDATDMKDTDGNRYSYAFEITLDGTSDVEYYCDQVFINAWNVEWTVSTTDETSKDDMFVVTYEEWTDDASYCDGSWANDLSTAFSSGEDVSAAEPDTTCAYDVYFMYGDGETAGGVTVDATTQTFTVYTDNSVVTAASAFALAGVAAMFF